MAGDDIVVQPKEFVRVIILEYYFKFFCVIVLIGIYLLVLVFVYYSYRRLRSKIHYFLLYHRVCSVLSTTLDC
jgi:hypothetical protein